MPASIVFGASGAIGRFLLPRLVASGHEVIAISREPRASTRAGLRWIAGDLAAPIAGLPENATVFSLGPLDRFADWLERNAEIETPRIVAIGSISATTKRDSPDPREREVAARLVDAERRIEGIAAERGAASTILRATLIYGAGLDRSLTPIVRFAERWRVFPSMHRARGLRQPVHADDIANACVRLARMNLPRRVYAIGGGERLAFEAMLARVRRSFPFATLALPFTPGLARAAASLARRSASFRAASDAALGRMQEDLVAENAAATADFGWSPRDFHPAPRDWSPPPLP